MKDLFIRCSLLIFIMAALISCKQVTQSFKDTFNGKQRQSQEDALLKSNSDDNNNSPNFLDDSHGLESAQISLKNIPELKGKTINIFKDVDMYDDGRIMLQVQDPDTLVNVNAYVYSSAKEWSPKQPVNVGNLTADDVTRQTIPLDSVHFATVARLAEIYADSAKRYGSTTRLSHVYYVQDVHEWHCNDIEGTRSNYEIFFNLNGSVKEFTKQ